MTTISEPLQAHLAYMRKRDAPLPLSHSQGNLAALHLRVRGLTYSAIALVMADYHGLHLSEAGWRGRLREMGAEPRHHPNGTLRIPPQLQEPRS